MARDKMERALPAVRGDDFDEGDLDMQGFAVELVNRARSQGVELAGENGLLTAMVRQVLQTGLKFIPFFDFPVELRRLVYTTNSIESLNARFRKAARHRAHFPTEQSAMKVLYLVAIERRQNRSNPTGRIAGWKSILTALTIHYGDRIAH